MTDVTKASEVEATTDKSEQKLAAEAARKRVAARQARQEALRRSGAEVPSSDAGLAGRLESGLRRRETDAAKAFRARKAARRALENRQ